MQFPSLHGKISYIANQTPDHLAIEQGERTVSYHELEKRSNQIGNFLQEQLKDAQNIPIMLENSISLVESVLGVMKAGGVFAPLDPNFPESRLKMMIKKIDASWVITETTWLAKLDQMMEGEGAQINVLVLDEPTDPGELANLNIFTLDETISTENHFSPEIVNKHCYIYFTSGSTGTPKAILGRHRSLKHFIDWEIGEFQVDQTCRVSQLISPSFDPILRDIFVPLCVGGTLCIPESREILLFPQRLQEWIHESRVTLVHLIPTLFKAMAQEIKDANIFPELKYIMLAGELLRGNDLKRFYQIFGSRIQLVNLYGPTETTMVKLFYRVNEADAAKSIIPVGKPLPGAQVMVLNKHQQHCPPGSIGEVYIRTPFITSGYYQDRELTRTVFLKNPFSDNPQDIIYKTGDLGRLLQNGDLEIIGRADHQVKVRGVRIELGEVENQILQMEPINEVVVMAREDEGGNKFLCAYFVADQQLEVSALREKLLQQVPDYMVPSYFVQLDAMPLTPNGKVDRKALPEPDQLASGVEYVAPRNPLEEKLVAIWSEILGVEGIGVEHDFFEMGGHSLKAGVLVGAIHKELQVEVPLKEIFANSTIAELATYIQQAEQSIYTSIQPVASREYYPVSSAQKRLYILNQFEGPNTTYNMPKAIVIHGVLDRKKVEASLQALLARHETLRTSFVTRDGEILQRIHPKLELKIIDLSGISIDEAVEEFIQPFDLSQAPLLRVGLVKLGAEKQMLLFDMHHIISDGTSMGILVREFVSLYEGLELSPLPIQYKDFSAWQNELFATGEMDGQEQYWLDVYADEIPVLNLPTDKPRPAIQSFEGDQVIFEVDQDLTNKLYDMAKRTGATLYMILLASYNLLLAKYSGQEDIVVGSPIAGRSHPDLQGIIGVFVNFLAFRNAPEGQKRFSEFLQEIQHNALKAYENQDYPFEQLIDKLNLKKDLSRNALFDTMFILQNTNQTTMQIEGLTVEPYTSEQKVSKLDLILNGIEKDGKIEFILEYCSKLFHRATIERLAVHFTNILSIITEDSEILLKEVEILSEQEKANLLAPNNDTQWPYAKELTIHQLFEARVAKVPDQIALVFEDLTLTYQELNQRANQLARQLRTSGVEKGDIVGIVTARSVEMIVGILATLKAGAAYLPVDPEYPAERIEYILQDSQTKVVLTQRKYVEQGVILSGMSTLTLDDEQLYQGEDSNLALPLCSEDLAYLIYTSGSTGKPKGVMIPHRAVHNLLVGFTEKIDLAPTKSFLALTSISFDMSVLEIFLPLIKGLKLFIGTEMHQQDPHALSKLISDHQIDILQMTPSRIKMFLSEREMISCLEQVQEILIGGEAFPEELLEVLQKSTNAKILNVYGPTETTVWSMVKDLTTAEEVTIGTPIANTQIYIVNQYGQLQPMGVAGELCISGDGMAQGYVKRPELTAEKFVANPFQASTLPADSTKMYRTGDLAKWLPNGEVKFLGRIDNQVKIRGYRIELGEIESQLLTHPAIQEAVVAAQDDAQGNKQLCAYWVGKDELTVRELREYLTQELPDYMLPSYFVQLEQIPLTPNGKVNRKALPTFDGELNLGVEYVPPTNELEEKLVTIWEELLEIPQIGIDHNFFEVGGHSLKATNLLAKVHKELNREINLRDIFQHPTIRKMAAHLEGAKESLYSSIRPVEKKPYYLASSAQKRLYMLSQFKGAGTSISYNIPGAMRLTGRLELKRLEAVFQELVDRHEAFRTSFELIDGEIVQKIAPQVQFAVSYFEAGQNREEEEEIIQQFIRPFELNQAPLLRTGVIKQSEDQYILLFDMHHIISDGVSMEILKREFISLYYGQALPPLTIQYKDFSEWQNQLISTGEFAKQEQFWLETFAGKIPVLAMPTDEPRPAIQTFEGSNLAFDLDPELTAKVIAFSKEQGVTIYMVLLAAYYVLLFKYTGQEDIVIGSPIAGRNHADLANVIGMFVNTLPMRNYPIGDQTFVQFLQSVKERTLQSMEHQDYQFEELITKLNLPQDLSRNSLYDAVFVLQNTDDGKSEIQVGDLQFTPYAFKNTIAKFDLQLTAKELNDQILFNLIYNSMLFKAETMERFGEHYLLILQQLLTDPELQLYDISLFYQQGQAEVTQGLQQVSAEREADTESGQSSIEADFDF